jgi:hypothetical protein
MKISLGLLSTPALGLTLIPSAFTLSSLKGKNIVSCYQDKLKFNYFLVRVSYTDLDFCFVYIHRREEPE